MHVLRLLESWKCADYDGMCSSSWGRLSSAEIITQLPRSNSVRKKGRPASIERRRRHWKPSEQVKQMLVEIRPDIFYALLNWVDGSVLAAGGPEIVMQIVLDVI
eukprot:gnl/TRDRNA2_/TRDRNA2_134825_c0_seq1.p2 gnl/TRDRNA2_/TRDRNA2_134825_c0~~gnl/TRDRNA2_/TRDRNA2_134825_c0_seq1.p2  ORF type:complete len:104 (-),score=14.22 gnl/TRDRNA2_/TRDRNA2_134825_c0_seq1:26-337(-)